MICNWYFRSFLLYLFIINVNCDQDAGIVKCEKDDWDENAVVCENINIQSESESQKLTVVSEWYNYVEVTVYKSHLKILPSLFFYAYPDLQKLFLDKCGIRKITGKEVFRNATNLELLSLNENKLTILKDDIFFHLKRLTTISMYGNQIRTIEPRAFNGLHKLTSIILNTNQLTHIAPSVFDYCPKIEELDFTHNQIRNFGKEYMIKMPKLKEAFFSNMSLDTLYIPKGLELMFASENNITSIIVDDSEPSSLKNLRLGYTNLKDLSNLTKFAKLEAIDFTGNKLQTLNLGFFTKLKELQVLILNENGLKTIEMGDAKEQHVLKFLSLKGNNFTTLNLDVFSVFPVLEDLSLEDNQLISIEYENIKKIFPELHTASIGANEWNCDFLSKMSEFFKNLGVVIAWSENKCVETSMVGPICCKK